MDASARNQRAWYLLKITDIAVKHEVLRSEVQRAVYKDQELELPEARSELLRVKLRLLWRIS